MTKNKVFKVNALVTALAASLTAHADQVILDDLIVDGSICVGQDCVNGESFGFDTLRLKENNLRIKAVDTSSTSSFPTNDWQITFNDSANGGANKFSIDDVDGGRTPFTIEASAPSHSLYVDDGGRLGLGTSTPVVQVHVKDGNTPTLRLEQDGSSGFTAQTWDVAGNEANFFVRDATNGSKLSFRIEPSAPQSSLHIDSSGNIGLGDATPDAALDIESGDIQVTSGQIRIGGTNGTTALASGLPTLLSMTSATGQHALARIDTSDNNQVAQLHFSHANDDKWILGSRSTVDGSSSNRFGVFNADEKEVLTIHQNGSLFVGEDSNVARSDTHLIAATNGAYLSQAGVWTNASSRYLKENIKEISFESALETLLKLDPVTYNYLTSPQEQYAGFIAEDVPDLVATKDRKGLSSMDIVAVLTKVIQLQQKSIKKLENKVFKAK